MRAALCLLAALAAATLSPAMQSPVHADEGHPGEHYAALGSSYAAGPGVTQSADEPANRCARSRDNYPQQLARLRHMELTDVSCSGAATSHILSAWAELPPQIDAVRPDTALVTISIGGNDVGFIGGLMAASCGSGAPIPPGAAPMCSAMAARATAGAGSPLSAIDRPLTDETWQALAGRLDTVMQEIRLRAPHARIILVSYPVVLPEHGGCEAAPMNAAAAQRGRAIAERLHRETAEAARRAGAEMLDAAAVSRGHDVCADEPWVTGFAAPPAGGAFVAYHPNLAGMTAIARALDRMLDAAGRDHAAPGVNRGGAANDSF